MQLLAVLAIICRPTLFASIIYKENRRPWHKYTEKVQAEFRRE